MGILGAVLGMLPGDDIPKLAEDPGSSRCSIVSGKREGPCNTSGNGKRLAPQTLFWLCCTSRTLHHFQSSAGAHRGAPQGEWGAAVAGQPQSGSNWGI